MIDTNTYEGHSPKPWRLKVNQTTYSIINSNSQKIASVPCYDRCNIDSLLMRDAPLLLEEVQRLREGLQEIVSDFEIKKTDKWEMLFRIETILKGGEEE